MTEEEFRGAIKRLAMGDKEALRDIYQAYVKLIYVVTYDVLGRKEEAEDVTSDFFIKLIRVAGSYQSGFSHKAWLVQIAKNMALDVLRKRKHEMLEFETASEDEETGTIKEHADSSATGNVESQAVLAEDMKNALQKLSAEEKQIIDMKLYGGLKFKEIAKLLERPLGTVTWTYNQGIKKLRRYLADYE